MGRILSIDLAYKRIRDFGVCLIEELRGWPTQVSFFSPSELGFCDPPRPEQLADAIFEFCQEGRIPIVLLDGPQGWKDPASRVRHCRVCEKALNAMAKTGIEYQVKPRNFTRFVQFSISLFGELVKLGAVLVEGAVISIPSGGLLAVESYPRSAWRKLDTPPLPGKKKAKPADIRQRLQTLIELFGFRIERDPTHDELCALVAGLAGPAILAGTPAGYIAEGSPPRSVGGVVVEGYIVNPRWGPRPLNEGSTNEGL